MSTAADTNGAIHALTPEQLNTARFLGEHWTPEGNRQKASLALSGALLRAHWPIPRVEEFVAAVAEAAHDQEAHKRVEVVAGTAEKLSAGEAVTGLPALSKLLGNDIVDQVQENLGLRRLACTYDYKDEAGILLYQAVRFEPKDFKQRQSDGKGGWKWHLQGRPRVLYGLPELLAADPSEPVFVVEGEKDVETLRQLGLIATTNVCGAGKWRSEYNEALRGRHVVILPDHDAPGHEHADDVARNLSGIAASVRVLELPGLPEHSDVSDWFAVSGTTEQLRELAEAAPLWKDVHPESKSVSFSAPPWPEQLAEEAYYGLAGDIVRAIEPHSEADPAGLLIQILVGFGNLIGRTACFLAEEDTHYLNEFVILIGRTSKGRKGSSWGRVRKLLHDADEGWAEERIQSGLSSGEGLIWAVRDPIMGREKIKEKGQVVGYEEIEVDPGVSDKRLLVYEPEYAQVLRQIERQGNTLSAILRMSWDSSSLRTLTKNSPAKAAGAHISLIGHCTDEELRRYLSTTEAANGYGNRHLWVCVRRSKQLPEGSPLPANALAGFKEKLSATATFARQVGVLQRDEEARALWCQVYGPLSEGKPGMTGSMLARAEAHVMRLACLYAVLDQSWVVRSEHLLAALACWDYVERSVRFVFGDALGDPVADEIVRALRNAPAGMTRSEIRDFFGRHQSSDRIGRALGLLLEHGLARFEKTPTDGRPEERWFAGGGTAP